MTLAALMRGAVGPEALRTSGPHQDLDDDRSEATLALYFSL